MLVGPKIREDFGLAYNICEDFPSSNKIHHRKIKELISIYQKYPRKNIIPKVCGLYAVYVEIGEGEYYYGIDMTLAGEFEIASDQTAVEEISAASNEEPVIYNMQGARVKAMQQGLYIINGKKVLVK